MAAHVDIGIYPVNGEPDRYFVRSRGKSGLTYLVDLDELQSGWCGCPHFEYRSGMQLVEAFECKHIRAARTYRSLQHKLFGLRSLRRAS